MLFRYVLILFFVCGASRAFAESHLTVHITDQQGLPVSDAVVSIQPTQPDHQPPASQPMHTEMIQKDRAFIPYVLPIRVNTVVDFPNQDPFQHQVYSFSPTKRFELKLYNGLNPEPVVFDRTGVVTVGCNIHDWMLGYIVVVDTPYFVKTNTDGIATFTVPEDRYWIDVWHPQIEHPVKRSTVLDQTAQDINISLTLSRPGKPETPDEDNFNFDYSPL